MCLKLLMLHYRVSDFSSFLLGCIQCSKSMFFLRYLIQFEIHGCISHSSVFYILQRQIMSISSFWFEVYIWLFIYNFGAVHILYNFLLFRITFFFYVIYFKSSRILYTLDTFSFTKIIKESTLSASYDSFISHR